MFSLKLHWLPERDVLFGTDRFRYGFLLARIEPDGQIWRQDICARVEEVDDPYFLAKMLRYFVDGLERCARGETANAVGLNPAKHALLKTE